MSVEKVALVDLPPLHEPGTRNPPLAKSNRVSEGERDRPVSKAGLFREVLTSPDLEFLLEAHNGISARIAEEAGFPAIWASGLALSAQYGVRDSNEASWTQVLEMLEFMSDATTIPILLDGDTGYGNFNNMRRLVRKLEQRRIAAVCIEDKIFPKTNSFINGSKQRLADVDEFTGKIKAGKDAQSDDSFSIIARVEALIAGWGMGEALRRAEAYRLAGADAILIHSAKSTADQVLRFQKEWARRSPLVIVPTKYSSTPTSVFREAGFSVVIWANHLLRSAVAAMRESARILACEQSALPLEHRITPVDEIFRLQGAPELRDAEARYLPCGTSTPRAIILAASRGTALGALTTSKPKAMISIGGRPLLGQIVDAYNDAGVRDITVVRGYMKETIDLEDLKYVDNDDFDGTGELVSLSAGLEDAADTSQDLIVSYGDVLFRRSVLDSLDIEDEDFVIAVDPAWRASVSREHHPDYVQCSEPSTRPAFCARTLLVACRKDIERDHRHGEWTGFLRVSATAVPRLRSIIQEMDLRLESRLATMHELLTALVERGEQVRVAYTTGNWLDVNSLEDVAAAGSFGRK